MLSSPIFVTGVERCVLCTRNALLSWHVFSHVRVFVNQVHVLCLERLVDLLIFASCVECDGVCSPVRVRICCLRGESVPFWIPRAEPVTWFARAKVLVCRVLRESDGLDSCWFCLSSCV